MGMREQEIRWRVNARLHEAVRNRERHWHIVATLRGMNRRGEQPRPLPALPWDTEICREMCEGVSAGKESMRGAQRV